jgi:hypothetical protein
MDEKSFDLQLERMSLSPEVPPVPAYHFALTRIGNQILLEPGYVDFVELRVALEQARAGSSSDPVHVQLFIKEKYLMDRETLIRLRDAAEQILQGMPESP